MGRALRSVQAVWASAPDWATEGTPMSVPEGCPPFDSDGLDGLPAIANQAQVATFFGVQPARVREWQRGLMAKKREVTPLPYVRIANAPFFNRSQIAWWLRQIQEAPDSAMVDVKRALREDSR